jgi:hypothetical protein
MSTPTLYRGLWPQNVSKLAKYRVSFENTVWKVSVQYDIGEGLRYLAVEKDQRDVVERVNAVKTHLRSTPGGVFYVNEYRHILVPVAGSADTANALYFSAGRLEQDFAFQFEGKPLTSRPVDAQGQPLVPGTKWTGPRPGIPYKLKAGGADIAYETPALTDTDPPEVRQGVTRNVELSKILKDKAAVARAVRPIATVRGYQGGRFYVNEHGAIFTPVEGADGNGLEYIYCGQIDRTAWFPEPPLPLVV